MAGSRERIRIPRTKEQRRPTSSLPATNERQARQLAFQSGNERTGDGHGARAYPPHPYTSYLPVPRDATFRPESFHLRSQRFSTQFYSAPYPLVNLMYMASRLLT
jgi:hypothetical protein